MNTTARLAAVGTAVALGMASLVGPAAAQGGAVGGTGGRYFLNDSFTGTANTVFSYGDAGDDVYVGDWDGNGSDTLLIRRGISFHVRNSNTSGAADRAFSYGDPGDTVLVGDWDGNGTDTLVVRRGNTFFVKNSITTGVADTVFSYGDPGDTVLVGDWDGNRTDTLAVRRGGQYFVKNSLTTGVADTTFVYGDPGDAVLVGRWSAGQRGDSLAVRRGYTYYLRYSLTSGVADKVFGYGNPNDTTLVGDWNGDGIDTLGVRRPPVAPAPGPGSSTGQDWLGEINRYRIGAGLTPVTENAAWTQGLLNHFNYLAKTPPSYFTGQYQNQHTENPASPYYTPDGALEGGRSNLSMASGNPPVAYIDQWLAAPFHGVTMLRPGLRQVAFASAQGYSGLDVLGGLSHQPHAAPILFPGPGMTTNLRSYATESPSPLQTCDWGAGSWGSSFGLPLIAMLPTAPVPGATASVTGSNGSAFSTSAGTLCMVNEHTYRTTDAVYGPTGLSILKSDRAVFLISKAVYAPGTYTASIDQPGAAAIRWTFTIV